jgi:CBS domain containing-hemolysin-like protein
MILLIFSILLYTLVAQTERRIVQSRPAEWEPLLTSGSAASERIRASLHDLRPVLAALLLARIILVVLIGVLLFYTLYNWPALRDMVSAQATGYGTSTRLFWMTLSVLAIALLAPFLWLLQQPIWTWLKPSIRLRWAFAFASFWRFLFRPFIHLPASKEPEELTTTALDATQEQSIRHTAGQHDIALLKSIVKFSDVTVKSVMQPRSKVVAIDFRLHFEDVLELVKDSGFSRLPVYDEDLDNITGILYVKDLVKHLDKGDGFEWQSIVRTSVLQVPESKHISDLLEEFKKEKLHMAIVVDEYGGTSGVVTMEDVLEEILGEIQDEFDEESEVRFRKINDFTYLFEAQAQLSDVSRITEIPEEAFDGVRGNADTLAGLVLELSGDIPVNGHEVHWDGYTLKVISADNRRIKQLRLSLPRS